MESDRPIKCEDSHSALPAVDAYSAGLTLLALVFYHLERHSTIGKLKEWSFVKRYFGPSRGVIESRHANLEEALLKLKDCFAGFDPEGMDEETERLCEAVDLLTLLLRVKAKTRLTVSEALRSAFLMEKTQDESSVDTSYSSDSPQGSDKILFSDS